MTDDRRPMVKRKRVLVAADLGRFHRAESTGPSERARRPSVHSTTRNQLIGKSAGHYRWQMQLYDGRFDGEAGHVARITSAVPRPPTSDTPRGRGCSDVATAAAVPRGIPRGIVLASDFQIALPFARAYSTFPRTVTAFVSPRSILPDRSALFVTCPIAEARIFSSIHCSG